MADGNDHDDELARVAGGALPCSSSRARLCANCGIDERGWIKVYWIQWRRCFPSCLLLIAAAAVSTNANTIGENQVPRTINMLNAFRDSLPSDVLSSLSTTPTRLPSPSNITAISSRGEDLWKSIYDPFDKKLYDKLASSHPDLPVHILHSEYGALFADPEEKVAGKVGRVLTSVVAVSCLRTQTGVGPQVLSHVFGLRKAFKDGTAERDVQGGEWLAGDEGSVWLLESVDKLVEALSGGKGSSYAPGLKAKL